MNGFCLSFTIPLAKALEFLSEDDPLYCMFQPDEGEVNYECESPREKIIELLKKTPESNIFASGPNANQMDLGIHINSLNTIHGRGSLFLKTKPSIRVGYTKKSNDFKNSTDEIKKQEEEKCKGSSS